MFQAIKQLEKKEQKEVQNSGRIGRNQEIHTEILKKGSVVQVNNKDFTIKGDFSTVQQIK